MLSTQTNMSLQTTRNSKTYNFQDGFQYERKKTNSLDSLRMRVLSNPEDSASITSSQRGQVFNNGETDVLNKMCSTPENEKITSNYWKLPERNYSYLTAISSHNDKPYLAISTSSKDSNLLIYELDLEKKLLSHHQSISLPDISALSWLDSVNPNETSERDDINFLLTGHSNGNVHLSIIPEPENDVFQNAEIIKRFNHNKQLSYDGSYEADTEISKMEVSPRRWKSCNLNSLFSIFKSNLFLWDTTRSRAPILKHKSVGIKGFHASPCNDGLLGICGDYGIALLDLRALEGSPSLYAPESQISSTANNIKWSPYDSNVLASSYDDGVVRLWDVRMTKNSFAKLEGHKDTVTSIEWSETDTDHLLTSSKDGNIIHWDLSDFRNYTEIGREMKCGLKTGLDTLTLVHKQGRIELAEDLIATRQCGTLIPASSNGIIDLLSIKNGQFLSIDGSSYLGLHDKNITSPILESETMIQDMLTKFAGERQLSSEQDDDSFESMASPSTPTSHIFGLQSGARSSETLLPVSESNSPQRITSNSTAETLISSPVLKRRSQFVTKPLPMPSAEELILVKSGVANPTHQMPKDHYKRDSIFNKADARQFINKLRDFSGNTLTEDNDHNDKEGLLTDLSIEDDFTFQPVLPLSVGRMRPAAY